MVDVFISYARRDGASLAKKLTASLRAATLDVFWDQDSIPAGANWERTLDNALETAAHIIVILTPFSIKSEEVEAEWRPMLGKGKNIIPVMYVPCEIPRRLSMRQYIDFQDEARYPLALTELITVINNFSPQQIEPDLSADELKARAKAYEESGNKALAAQDYLMLLRNPQAEFRRSAARHLGALKVTSVLPEILTALHAEKDAEMQAKLVECIGRIINTETWQPIVPDMLIQLTPFLSAENPETRSQTARLFGAAGAAQMIQTLAGVIMRDAVPDVRVRAILAVGRIGGEDAIKTLIWLLKETNPEVRQAAANALGFCGDKSALEMLRFTVRRDKDSGARQAASEAIDAIERR